MIDPTCEKCQKRTLASSFNPCTSQGRLNCACECHEENQVAMKAEKLKLCRDCDDNFYNGTGAKECWALESAKPAQVFIVGTWQENPLQHMKPVDRLSCWHPQRGSGMSVMKREAK